MYSCLLLPNGMSLQAFTFQHEVVNKRASTRPASAASPASAARFQPNLKPCDPKKRRRLPSAVKGIPHAFFQTR